MTIFANSRYANAAIVSVEDNGVQETAAYRVFPSHGTQFLHYRVVAYDRLDNLAYRFFGDATQWWRIADANPEIFYPTDLTPGDVIRIPLS